MNENDVMENAVDTTVTENQEEECCCCGPTRLNPVNVLEVLRCCDRRNFSDCGNREFKISLYNWEDVICICLAKTDGFYRINTNFSIPGIFREALLIWLNGNQVAEKCFRAAFGFTGQYFKGITQEEQIVLYHGFNAGGFNTPLYFGLGDSSEVEHYEDTIIDISGCDTLADSDLAKVVDPALGDKYEIIIRAFFDLYAAHLISFFIYRFECMNGVSHLEITPEFAGLDEFARNMDYAIVNKADLKNRQMKKFYEEGRDIGKVVGASASMNAATKAAGKSVEKKATTARDTIRSAASKKTGRR